MDRKNRRTARLLRFSVILALAFLSASGSFPDHAAAAGDQKVICGLVRSVSDSHIFLDGRSIDLAGVSIQNPSGKEISVAEIIPGTKVGLFFRRGTLESVLVYPPMTE